MYNRAQIRTRFPNLPHATRAASYPSALAESARWPTFIAFARSVASFALMARRQRATIAEAADPVRTLAARWMMSFTERRESSSAWWFAARLRYSSARAGKQSRGREGGMMRGHGSEQSRVENAREGADLTHR